MKLKSVGGKFIIQDKDAKTIAVFDSAGNFVTSGTATVVGSEFSVGGSTFIIKGGRVGIGTTAPVAALDVNGGVRVGNYVSISTPSPAGIPGTIIFNTTVGKPYVSNGAVWKPLVSDYDSDGITDAIDVDDNDPNDATAVASDTLLGKTFYAGGGRKTGSLVGGSGHELPDTGQTLCYDGAGTVITCPAHGADAEQDGSYNPTATQPYYTDNGDFTITDNRTGLMWKKCSEGQNNDASCTGTAGMYVWAAALSQCTGLTTPGGYSDWRLPNIKELVSIVDYGTASPAKISIDFPNTQTGNFYWTSTTDVPSTAYAWGVVFLNGYMYYYGKTSSSFARCVRGGP